LADDLADRILDDVLAAATPPDRVAE